ncbi:MAG: restriction endonuclease subunit S [Methyloprofundus sp.]|nr:restriction endonuclease subunit S [Methyloprofundus sp.]
MSQVENLITQHLDIWTQGTEAKSTAGRGTRGKINLLGIQKLRELILEMAVRGLLVPQELNDEPASELLKKIAAEKAQLIKDGKIKKTKPLPEITDDEKPFELPKGWAWVRLPDIYYTISPSGKKLKASDILESGKFPVVDQGQNFISGYFDDESLLIKNPSCVVVFGDHTTNLKLIDFDFIAGADGTKILCPIVIDCEYFYRFLTGLKLEDRGYGRHFKILNDNLIAIPPLEEQKFIVAKVDELMALCDALETQTLDSIATHQTLVETLLGNLVNPDNSADSHQAWCLIEQHFDVLFTTEHSIDTLKQTILQLAFDGRLVKWDKYSSDVIKNCLDFGPRNGFSPPEVQEDTGVFVLKLGATSYGVFNPAEVKNVKVCIDEDSHLWVQKGDILVQRGNSKDFVGSNLLIEKDIEGTIYPDLMMKLRTSERVIPEYLSLSLSSIASRQYMWDRMTGTSGTMPKISKKIVENVPINVPIIFDQNKTVSKIRELFYLCDQLKNQLQAAQTTQCHLALSIAQMALD